MTTDLESFILQNTFNGSVLPAGGHFRLEDHAKGAVSYNFALRILHVPGFSGESILDLFTNHFYIFEPTQLWSNVVGREGRMGMGTGTGPAVAYPPCADPKTPRVDSGT